MLADSNFSFKLEIKELKCVGCGQPYTAGEKPYNMLKNRYKNLKTYDHTRVKLLLVNNEKGSDYINANWISGLNSPREFIATQVRRQLESGLRPA